jgi:hypothetical protein
MRGFERALLVASAIALVGSVVAAWLIRSHGTEPQGAPEQHRAHSIETA